MSPSKISRLPTTVREDLNIRLEQNVPGHEIAAWLNAHAEVLPVLKKYYDGAPINEQNISTWRQGPFLEWQVRQDFLAGLRHTTEEAAEAAATLGNLTENTSQVIAFHLLQRVIALTAPKPDRADIDPASAPAPTLPDDDIKLLSRIVRSISILRRGDIAAARLKLREREVAARFPSREEQSPDIITTLMQEIITGRAANRSKETSPPHSGASTSTSTPPGLAPVAPATLPPSPPSPPDPSSLANDPSPPPPEPEIKPYQAKSSSEPPPLPRLTAADIPERFIPRRRPRMKPRRVTPDRL